MPRVKPMLATALASVIPPLLTGCQLPPGTPAPGSRAAAAECPQALRAEVHVAASATAISLAHGNSAPPAAQVARRLMISTSTARAPGGLTVLESELSVSLVGGTFAGSASAAVAGFPTGDGRSSLREVSHDRALELIPGRLRVEPFLAPGKLRSQTLALDVTLLPGGSPASKLTVGLPPLWTPERRPLPPQALQITLDTQRLMTVYDVVEARIALEVAGTGPKDARDVWRCSYASRVTLLDHQSVLPALWDLHLPSREGRPERWLALFAPTVGPFRALFTDSAAVQAFATWLRATGATHVGRYQLGLFEADPGSDESTIPADRDIARTFAAASAEELRMLDIEHLGED